VSAPAREFVLGGQAVIEGVMMKGPVSFAVAVRRAGGEIVVRDFPAAPGPLRKRFLRVPVARGVVTMATMLAIGFRALQFSAEVAAADAGGAGCAEGAGGEGADRWAAAGAVLLAVALGIGLFVLLPLAAARGLAAVWPAAGGRWLFPLAEGAIRLALFTAYVAAIGLFRDVRRVFEYHGAEHKVVHAWERGADLRPESVRAFPRLHPRCGTSFVLFVMAVAVVVFSAVPPAWTLAEKALARLLLLPAVAGISYEVLRLSARRSASPWFRAVAAPGLWFQRLTTREPDPSQIEVALASFRRVALAGGPGGGGVE